MWYGTVLRSRALRALRAMCMQGYLGMVGY